MRKLKFVIFVIALALVPGAYAQLGPLTANVEITINFPEVLILYYNSPITVNIDASYFLSPNPYNEGDVVAFTVNSGSNVGDALVDGLPEPSGIGSTPAEIIFQNFWALRGLTNDTNGTMTFQHSPINTGEFTPGTGTGSINLTEIGISLDETGGGGFVNDTDCDTTTCSASVNFNPSVTLSLTTPEIGAGRIVVDFSNVTGPGSFTSNGFQLVAQTTP